jgi:uncharacterized protein
VSTPLRLSGSDARRALWGYGFAPGRLDEVARRLGTIQYDPLAPLGRNPDLVLQARVPGYRVDDWQGATYRRRLLVDAWDKMVCLTLSDDWPARHLFHDHFRERWRSRVFDHHGETVAAVLAELRERGPLDTLAFSDQSSHEGLRGSWYGPKLVKHVLRALWDSGEIVTHDRVRGRHVYHLAERSLPERVTSAPRLPGDVALDLLVRRRVQAPGLLRPTADTAVWLMPVPVVERREAVRRLVGEGTLHEVDVEGTRFLAVPELLATLDGLAHGATASGAALPAVRFVAPLDPLVWDRRGVAHLYGFDYVWEVYKPAAARRWGYYVLPVLWGETFVARFDARVERGRLVVHAWHWEGDLATAAPATLLAALEEAVTGFLAYLGVDTIRLPRGMGRAARDAWTRGARRAGAAATGVAS